MRNELQRHKRSDKVKWVLTGIMFFLAFVMIAGLILQVFGTGKAKPSEWFKKSDSEQTEQLPAEDGENATAHTRVKAMSATFSADEETDENDGIVLLSEDRFPTYNVSGTVFVARTNADGTFSKAGLWFMSFECILDTVNGGFRYRISINYMNGGYVGDSVPYDTDLYILHFPSGRTWDITELNEYENPKKGFHHVLDSVPVAYFGTGVGGYVNPCSSSFSSFASFEDGLFFECVRERVSLPPEPVKEGHTFVGWYYDSAFTRPYDGEPIYSDTELYAKFEINTFLVTFDTDDGRDVSYKRVNWNTTVSFDTPTREKYAFKGWFLSDGTQYTNQRIKADITLTAHWERNVFNVTFDTDGGTAVENMEVNLNSAVTLPTTTRTGYVFKGWFLPNGTEYTNQPVMDDISLTAHWEIQTFTVTFYVDGEVYATKTVEYGQGLAKVAETANLKMLSVRMESGMPTFDDNGVVVVTENCSVEAQEMSDTDKVINTVKNNKWAIIGGVAGGVALIAIIAAVCGGAKRKRRR